MGQVRCTSALRLLRGRGVGHLEHQEADELDRPVVQILSNPGKEIFVGVRGLQTGIIRQAAQPVILCGKVFCLDHILYEG